MADKQPRKVVRAEKAKGGGASDVVYQNHHQLFAHLVAAGPTMHGKPGDRKPRSH